MRCYGLFHPLVPSGPCVFVHVALMPALTSSMGAIQEARDKGNEGAATAAMFYSINR